MIKEAKTYQAYYTKSEPIVNYMVGCLGLQAGERLLEPCGGDGVFTDKIATLFPAVLQDVYEMNPDSFAHLESRYKFQPNIQVFQADTLLDEDLSFRSKFGGDYDKVIANPPYGAWQAYEKRDLLKKHYQGLYVKETYGLFLFRCVSLLKEGGKLVFIIPDTFLNLHLHKHLRQFLLTHAKIDRIDLFPSSFFPNVHFGYDNLCIISLEKCSNQHHCLAHSFSIRRDFGQVEELDFRETGSAYFLQKEIFSNEDHAFLIKDKTTAKTIRDAAQTIGDVADCVTGFYSGNDKVFLKTNSVRHRNAKNYQVINAPEIAGNFNSHSNILEGISDENACFIPIVKGGGFVFANPTIGLLIGQKQRSGITKRIKKRGFRMPDFISDRALPFRWSVQLLSPLRLWRTGFLTNPSLVFFQKRSV